MNTDSEWNRFISREIEQFLTAFQQIEIDVAPPGTAEPQIVRVHAPYMMQTVTLIDRPDRFALLKKRHRDRLLRVQAAREQAPEPIQRFLQRHFVDGNGREQLLAAGRAELADIQALLQEAVNQQLVPAGEAGLNGRTLRQWLQTYGIGVDCSSYVQQTLNHLLQAIQTATGRTEPLFRVPFLRSFGVYKAVKNGEIKREPLFVPVGTPSAGRPGDILVKYGHIRIVAGVERGDNGRFLLHLAESTSAPGIPIGQTEIEADVGPRRLRVCYPEPHKPIGAQRPLRQRQHDPVFQESDEETEYLIGRFIPLTQ